MPIFGDGFMAVWGMVIFMGETETILSVGIDIGTTTTQLVFSRLILNNTSGYGMTPNIEIADKKILYHSHIYFTPLNNQDEIDGSAVCDIIDGEYKKAGFSKSDIDTGAVIITGESSRKRNAREVCEAISEFSGDFVVASAGPDLESVLAGRGSGCAAISETVAYIGKKLCNLDIGGGTSNLCVFLNGEVVSVSCLDIGGRLIRVDGKRVVKYIAPKLKNLLSSHYAHTIKLSVGDALDGNTAEKICTLMSEVLETAVGLRSENADLEMLLTNRQLTCRPDIFTFSGGIADCIKEDYDDFAFGDVGVIFGRVLRKSRFFTEATTISPLETMRATVIGAGNYSVNLSGSTIEYQNCSFPLKGIPVMRVELDNPLQIEKYEMKLRKAIGIHEQIADKKTGAIAFYGLENPTFKQIERIADEISRAVAGSGSGGVILVIERDMAKALGQALKRRLGRGASFICIDGIRCNDGDFLDIGLPVAEGKVVPVVVKTLIFG